MSLSLKRGDTQMIVDACLEHDLLRNQCAYVLATAYHETAHSMKPVREMGGEKYLQAKKYYPYVGMGYVQLTWKANYEKAGNKLGVDFLGNPKLLLKAEYAAPILVIGSKEGWFTGKKLSDYITLSRSDFVGARRIINGTDRAELIADYARQYDALLKAAGYGVEAQPRDTKPVVSHEQPILIDKPALPTGPVVVHVEDNPPAVKPGPAPKPKMGFWQSVFEALMGWIFGRQK